MQSTCQEVLQFLTTKTAPHPMTFAKAAGEHHISSSWGNTIVFAQGELALGSSDISWTGWKLKSSLPKVTRLWTVATVVYTTQSDVKCFCTRPPSHICWARFHQIQVKNHPPTSTLAVWRCLKFVLLWHYASLYAIIFYPSSHFGVVSLAETWYAQHARPWSVLTDPNGIPSCYQLLLALPCRGTSGPKLQFPRYVSLALCAH